MSDNNNLYTEVIQRATTHNIVSEYADRVDDIKSRSLIAALGCTYLLPSVRGSPLSQ